MSVILTPIYNPLPNPDGSHFSVHLVTHLVFFFLPSQPYHLVLDLTGTWLGAVHSSVPSVSDFISNAIKSWSFQTRIMALSMGQNVSIDFIPFTCLKFFVTPHFL